MKIEEKYRKNKNNKQQNQKQNKKMDFRKISDFWNPIIAPLSGSHGLSEGRNQAGPKGSKPARRAATQKLGPRGAPRLLLEDIFDSETDPKRANVNVSPTNPLHFIPKYFAVAGDII